MSAMYIVGFRARQAAHQSNRHDYRVHWARYEHNTRYHMEVMTIYAPADWQLLSERDRCDWLNGWNSGYSAVHAGMD